MSFISINLNDLITGLGRGEFEVVEPGQIGKRSAVWDSFSFLRRRLDGEFVDSVKCKKCRSLFKFFYKTSTTSNLVKHVRFCQNNDKPTNKFRRMSAPDKEILKRVAGQYVALDKKPLESLNNEGFQSILSIHSAIHMRYVAASVAEIGDVMIPSRRVTAEGLAAMRNKTLAIIKDELHAAINNQHTISVSLDIWSDRFAKRSYLGLLAHFVHPDFPNEIKVRHIAHRHLLNTQHATIREKIDEVLLECLQLTEDQRVNCVNFVSDRGSNIMKACEPPFANRRANCAAHMIQNIVQQMIKIGSGQPHNILVACNKLVSHYRRSTIAHTELATTLKLTTDTRWSSLFVSIRSICENFVAIRNSLEHERNLNMLNEIQLADLEAMMGFLKPLRDITDQVQREIYPTLHKVLAHFGTIIDDLDIGDDVPVVRAMKQSCSLYAREIYADLRRSHVHQMATFLFPPKKDLYDFTAVQITGIHEMVCSSIKSKCEHIGNN